MPASGAMQQRTNSESRSQIHEHCENVDRGSYLAELVVSCIFGTAMLFVILWAAVNMWNLSVPLLNRMSPETWRKQEVTSKRVLATTSLLYLSTVVAWFALIGYDSVSFHCSSNGRPQHARIPFYVLFTFVFLLKVYTYLYLCYHRLVVSFEGTDYRVSLCFTRTAQLISVMGAAFAVVFLLLHLTPPLRKRWQMALTFLTFSLLIYCVLLVAFGMQFVSRLLRVVTNRRRTIWSASVPKPHERQDSEKRVSAKIVQDNRAIMIELDFTQRRIVRVASQQTVLICTSTIGLFVFMAFGAADFFANGSYKLSAHIMVSIEMLCVVIAVSFGFPYANDMYSKYCHYSHWLVYKCLEKAATQKLVEKEVEKRQSQRDAIDAANAAAALEAELGVSEFNISDGGRQNATTKETQSATLTTTSTSVELKITQKTPSPPTIENGTTDY